MNLGSDRDEFELRPISYLALAPDFWRVELAWLRELVADADALDTWEAEGGALAAPEVP